MIPTLLKVLLVALLLCSCATPRPCWHPSMIKDEAVPMVALNSSHMEHV